MTPTAAKPKLASGVKARIGHLLPARAHVSTRTRWGNRRRVRRRASGRSNYNYKRDYDPATGRYVESDPLGLDGGSNSTYAYAAGNPLLNIDPRGLDATIGYFPGGLDHVGIGVNSSDTAGLYPLGAPFFFCNPVEGAVQHDQSTQKGPSKKGARYLAIHTTPVQDAQIQQFIDAAYQRSSSGQQSYNLCFNQCTNFVRAALRAGGVVLPVDATFDPIPETFFNSLQSTYDPWQPFPGVQ